MVTIKMIPNINKSKTTLTIYDESLFYEALKEEKNT